MAALSKAEYLKRYLSKDQLPKDEKKKKRKKLKAPKDSRLRIIDDDVDFRKKSGDDVDLEDEDEAPLVAEVVDERPKHVQQLEAYRKSNRWKVMGKKDEQDEMSLDYGVISTNSPKQVISQGRRKRHDSSNSESDQASSQQSRPARRTRHDSSSSCDNSPIRRGPQEAHGENSSDSKRLVKKRHDSDSDVSQPCKIKSRKNSNDSETSPSRKSKTSKHSPTKKSSKSNSQSPRSRSDAGVSPPRKHSKRHDSDSDQSPLRRKDGELDSDQSPPRKSKGGSNSDQSPPRKRRSGSDSDQSSLRKPKGGSDSDQSPPRKRNGSDSDQSPPRKRNRGSDSDQSPPRNKNSVPSSKTISQRKRLHSPSQDKRNQESRGKIRKSRFDNAAGDDAEQKKATKTLAGAKAGLSSARDMKEEAKKLKEKEERSFQNIDEETLGRNARTVVRDKETGKRRNLQAEEAKNAAEEKKKEEQKKKYDRWGKGVKQANDRETILQDAVHEAMKPLARYADDKDLDSMQRQEERAEDPMLAYIHNKKKKEEAKAGGKKKKELPRYKGPAPPPNRYNIMPGYRWDGVDRSNGFEKKIFAHRADRAAVKEMAYKWSTEDM